MKTAKLVIDRSSDGAGFDLILTTPPEDINFRSETTGQANEPEQFKLEVRGMFAALICVFILNVMETKKSAAEVSGVAEKA